MMCRRNITAVMMAIIVALVSAGIAFAIPPVINYQGKLVDSVGDPVNTDVDITFTIYNAPTGGDVLWTETQTVGVVNGIFNVYLGIIEEITVSTFSTDVVYLGIQVAGNAEMTPRQLYSAAPFAFRSHTADMVAEGAVTSAMIANGAITGTDIAIDTITSNEIASGAVGTSEIAGGSVDTSKLALDAVTTDQIADGTITGTDIASETITAGNIATNAVGNSELGPLAVTTENLGASSVNSNIILNDTIVDEDISAGAGISASKINTAGLDADKLDGKESTDFFDRATFDLDADDVIDSANDADTLDGEDSSVFSKKYEKIAVVALSGGDYTSPVAAANDYLTWCGTPSMTNPCLIKVMPGIYDIGTSTVVLQPLLSIEGSGINATLINGTIAGITSGVINGAGTSEIKHLSVQNHGGGTYGITIYNNDNVTGDAVRIYDVRAIAEGATRCYTIFNDDGASAEIRTVKVYAECANQNIAIFGDTDSELIVENTDVEVNNGSTDAYGISFNFSSSSFMSNVNVEASSSGTTTVSAVRYFSSTGEMHNVKVKASGGSPNGILIESNSNVTMKNVTATASDPASGKNTSGIKISGSDVDIEGVSIEATNPAATDYVYGLYADASSSGSLNIKGMRVTATGGLDCYGIYALNSAVGYIPMTDVQIWSFGEVARGIYAWGGDFGMKNLEAYGSGGSGGGSTGISLMNAYANMQSVEALGNGGDSSINEGIRVQASDIEGVNVKAQGEGDTNSTNYGLYVTDAGSEARITGGYIKTYGGLEGFGVYLNASPTVELNGVKVLVTDATDFAYGLFLNTGSVELNGVKVEATNATANYGINGSGAGGNITLRNSVIEGADYTVTAISGYFFSAASSGFIGPVPAGGMAIQCVNSHQESGGVLNGLGTGCTVP